MPNTSAPTSFIPHEATQTPGNTRPRGGGSGLSDLFVLIAIVLFVASAALAVGVFLYQQYLQSSDTSKVDQLERAKAAFEPSLIQELTRLDDRMYAAGQILGAHVAPSVFFHMLEQTTITTVAFRSLDFTATGAEHMTITMSGVADSVNSVALQADLFAKGGMITSPIFSNIDREVDGVHFNLSALVNPAAINYLQLAISPGPAASQQESPVSPFGGDASQQGQTPPASQQIPGAQPGAAGGAQTQQ